MIVIVDDFKLIVGNLLVVGDVLLFVWFKLVENLDILRKMIK